MTDERMTDLIILPLANGGLELLQQDGTDEADIIDLHPAQIRLLAERAGLLAAPEPKLLERLSAAHVLRLHALRDQIDEVIAELGIADGVQREAGMSTGRILFVDTETTGLPQWNLPADDPSQPRVVDLAGLLCDADGKEVGRFESIVKPDRKSVV